MLPPKLAVTVAAALAASLLLVSSAFAETDSAKFSQIFNSVNGTYTSLQKVTAAHNKWVGTHHGNCARSQTGKWWVKRYTQAAKDVTSAEKRLSSVGAKAKRTKTYRDFVQTFDDLTHWMAKKIEPRLFSCKGMPGKSGAVSNDLQNLANDLGIINY